MKEVQKLFFCAILLASGIALYAQDSTATIHFYRTGAAKGAMVTYKLFTDTTLLGVVKPNTVIHYTAKVGTNEFHSKTEVKKTLSVNAKPGEEYYIKCSVAMGVFVGTPKFELVSKTEGAEAIAKLEAKKEKQDQKRKKSQ